MYLSIEQAAEILHCTSRTVYSYIERGKLTATRASRRTLLDKEEVCQFVRDPVGRKRVRFPCWRASKDGNRQSITSISLPLCQEQRQQFLAKLQEIRKQNQHRFPGTVARYITFQEQIPERVQIVLIWRKAIEPSGEEREAALRALQTDLAQVLEWKDAVCEERTVLLHT